MKHLTLNIPDNVNLNERETKRAKTVNKIQSSNFGLSTCKRIYASQIMVKLK